MSLSVSMSLWIALKKTATLSEQNLLIETNHNPSVFPKKNAGNNRRLLRWALCLQSYHSAIKHRSGKDIQHADCLSRLE